MIAPADVSRCLAGHGCERKETCRRWLGRHDAHPRLVVSDFSREAVCEHYRPAPAMAQESEKA